MFVYLDNSATTRPYDEVIDVMSKIQRENFGNPSSLHTLGVEAEKYLKNARKSLSASLGASENEVYFTSCGTESDNMALLGLCKNRRHMGKKIITTSVEHPAVLEPVKYLESIGFKIEYIGVDRNCRIDIKQIEKAMTEDTVMISVMSVNNETGTIFPIDKIGALKDKFNKEHGTDILFHTDAVQAFGKIPISVNGNYSSVDLISVSSHKIHGPKGVGGLYIKKNVNIPSLVLGGGQEKNMRSGTENTTGIGGFGTAIDLAFSGFDDRLKTIEDVRSLLLTGLKDQIADIIINSPQDETACPSVLNVSFMGTRGEVLLHTLEQDGIFVSTGSACSSNKKGQSHVLSAMGLSAKEIEGAIRFSFSEFNTKAEIEYVVEKVKNAVKRFRKLGSFR